MTNSGLQRDMKGIGRGFGVQGSELRFMINWPIHVVLLNRDYPGYFIPPRP